MIDILASVQKSLLSKEAIKLAFTMEGYASRVFKMKKPSMKDRKKDKKYYKRNKSQILKDQRKYRRKNKRHLFKRLRKRHYLRPWVKR